MVRISMIVEPAEGASPILLEPPNHFGRKS